MRQEELPRWKEEPGECPGAGAGLLPEVCEAAAGGQRVVAGEGATDVKGGGTSSQATRCLRDLGVILN